MSRDHALSDGQAVRSLLWYWPHPHRDAPSPMVVASAASVPDVAPTSVRTQVTVQALGSFEGQALPPYQDEHYRVVRDLPGNDRGFARLPRIGPLSVRLRRVIRRGRLADAVSADAVCVQNLDAIVDWWFLARLRRRRPVIGVVHNVAPHAFELPEALERRLWRRTYDSCDRLLVGHEAMVPLLTDGFGVSRAKIDVVPLAFPPPEVLEREPHPEGRPVRFLVFGGMHEYKGVALVRDALALIPDTPLEVRLAGRGDAAIERLAKGLAATDHRCRAEIGYVTETRKDELFRWADVVLLAYPRFAAQSGVMHDAYRWLVPVIATDVGALGASVREDGTGLVIPPLDERALAAAMKSVVEQPARLDLLAARVVAARYRTTERDVGELVRASISAAGATWAERAGRSTRRAAATD